MSRPGTQFGRAACTMHDVPASRHRVAVNSTPDPAGGAIDRVAGSKTPGSFGTPTGVLRENAVSRVWELALEAENKGSTILDGLKLCASNGICSVHTNDAGNFGDYQARAPLSLCIAHAPCLTCMVVVEMWICRRIL